MSVTVKTMPVVCSACGAERMTLAVHEDGDRRTVILTCPCGESDVTEERRHDVTACYCGPDEAAGPVDLGQVWA